MNFKQWFLKEDPEEPIITTIGKKHYAGDKEIKYPVKWNSHDALSFGILKDFYLYSDSSLGLYHKDILRELWNMIKYPGKKIYSMDEIPVDDIKTHGQINNEALNQIKNWMIAVEGDRFKIDREAVLFYSPDFILGRIWTEEKVISFWNKEKNVFNLSNDIIKFISLFGNPSDYMFEIENKWRDYGDFLKKTLKGSSKTFDPSKLHLLDPSIKGKFLQTFIGSGKKLSKPGLKTRQIISTSE